MNFGLPTTTALLKLRYHKTDLYKGLSGVSTAWKNRFSAEVKTLWWRNKLATETLNVARGKRVTEVEVFELELRTKEGFDAKMLAELDARIPYHLIFVLSFEAKVQAWICYKEQARVGAKLTFKPGTYFHTPWMPREALALSVEGLDMDAVYEGLVRQIAARQGLVWAREATIAENIQFDKASTKVVREITALERKLARTVQLNRRLELKDKLRKLQAEYGKMKI